MARIVKIIFTVLFSLLLIFFILAILGYHWMNQSLPHVDDKVTIQGLADSVMVYRDGYQIPHILARNDEDLWFIQGYITAQDRFFQMDYWRHLSQGSLSNMLQEGCEKTDLLMSSIQIEKVADTLLSRLSSDNQKIYSAYTNGVNAYLKQYHNRLPLEYQLLHHEPAPWKVEDCLAVFLGYLFFMEFGGRESLIIPLFKTQANLKPIQKLLSHTLDSAPQVKDRIKTIVFLKQWNEAQTEGYLPNLLTGAHAWVVPETLTTTRKPLFAMNLPGMYDLPVIYYEIHLYSPLKNASGFSLPGFPALLYGYNSSLAWGGEYDLWIENPFATAYTNKDSDFSFFNVFNSSSLSDPGDALFQILQAENAIEGNSILETLKITGFSWVCVDTFGNVVDNSHPSKVIHFNSISHWMDQRTDMLMAEYSPVSMIDCQQIQIDNRSVLAEHLLPLLLHFLPENAECQEWINRFKKWDKNMRIGDPEALVFEVWTQKIVENIFLKKCNPIVLKSFMSLPGMWQSALIILLYEYSNNRDHLLNTPLFDSFEQKILLSFQDAIHEIERDQGKDVLKWSWGKAHALTFKHLLADMEAFALSRSLGVQQPLVLGSYSIDGCYASMADNCIHQGIKRCSGGTVARMIVDLNELDNTLSILSTGQSGQMNDVHYQDQVSLFTRGYYHPNLFDLDKIKKTGWPCFIGIPETHR